MGLAKGLLVLHMVLTAVAKTQISLPEVSLLDSERLAVTSTVHQTALVLINGKHKASCKQLPCLIRIPSGQLWASSPISITFYDSTNGLSKLGEITYTRQHDHSSPAKRLADAHPSLHTAPEVITSATGPRIIAYMTIENTPSVRQSWQKS